MVADVREAAPDARPPAGKPEREAARGPAGDRVLTCPGYDNAIRWRPGERLEQLFERRCDWLHLVGWDNHLAVDALDLTLSYAELDRLANQLATPVPFDHALSGQMPDFLWLECLLDNRGSGLDQPAAVIVETVQGEGGINVARPEWLRGLAGLCQRHGILLIVDDVQMGCGRTGPFFSFETAGITPDIVCLSKSISGYGLPLALTLIRPDLDVWEPGEHNGTFRGINPALVTGTAALRAYWQDDALERATQARGERINAALITLAGSVPGSPMLPRGRGLAHGLAFACGELAAKVSTAAFERGLLAETAGPQGEVVKLLPPLTITDTELDQGLEILSDAVRPVC